MSRDDNQSLLRTLELTREMKIIADYGDRVRKDGSCGVIYGILRDTAYKLQNMIEVEIEAHRKLGYWDSEEQASGSKT
ncbi:MAG: hypothetical protein HN356_02550 [Calditrichaeota bacterium]|mgnify:FL=1|nr:hypothetical protein [Calditrichota bacterium]MBT7617491.1 hypothetical protein [Calditrichota bacterium]